MKAGQFIRKLAMVIGFVWLAVMVVTLVVVVTASSEPDVPRGAVLVLRPGGEMPEIPRADVLAQLSGSSEETVSGFVASLRRAARDPRVEEVLVVPTTLDVAYWGKLQEMRDALLRFRESGKRVTAFLEYGGGREYLLATAADRVVMLPSSPLDLTGVASYALFLRDLFDTLGVEADYVFAGRYKTAPNQFTERGLTPEHRETLEALTADMYEQLVSSIAEARDLTAGEVRQLIDQGPLLASDALEAGLVDEVAYLDEVLEMAGAERERVPTIEGSVYRRVSSRSAGFRPDARIAVIYAVGVIASGPSRYDPVNGAVVGSDSLVRDIRRVSDEDSFQAVVLRVDSPGGSSVASDVIWRALQVARQRRPERPMIVSMGEVAASGGYYISMAGDTVLAQPGTVTGSIGVYAGKFAVGGFLERLGVTVEGVEFGQNAGLNSPFDPFSESQRASLDRFVQSFYEDFVNLVADARGVSADAIDAVAQGRVWSGAQALERGLVDQLGGLEEAVFIARDRAGIPADEDVELVTFPAPRSWFELLGEQLAGTAPLTEISSLVPTVLSPGERRVIGALVAPGTLFRRGEPLALLPYGMAW